MNFETVANGKGFKIQIAQKGGTAGGWVVRKRFNGRSTPVNYPGVYSTREAAVRFAEEKAGQKRANIFL